MKKKFFKVISMMLTVAMIGTSVNLSALAKEGSVETLGELTEVTKEVDAENEEAYA